MNNSIITVSKKQLCIWLGLQHPGGKLDYDSLKSQYFTPKALEVLQLNEQELKRIRKFNTIQSQKIIDLFNLREFLRVRRLL